MTSRPLSRRSKAVALVPLALLSGVWTASLVSSQRQRRRAPPTRSARSPTAPRCPTDAIEAPASVPVPGVIAPAVPEGSADSVVSGASSNGIPAPALVRLPARRADHRRRRQVLQHPVGADRRDRPGRVRPRPLRRQHPDRGRRQQARHLRHRAQRQERHPGDPRHRRRPARPGHGLRPRGRPDAVHPLDLAGRQGRRRRRRQAQPAGHRRRRRSRPPSTSAPARTTCPPARARRPRSTATTTARTT